MKPLTPEEQLQLQLDVQNLKSIVDQQKKDIEGLTTLITAINNNVISHHELIKSIVERIGSTKQ